MELKEFSSFQAAYKEYTAKHYDQYISQDEFEALILATPMFLVAQADGHLAATEISTITEKILSMYNHDEQLPSETETFDSNDFNNFLNDFDQWKDKFLQVLKEYIAQDTEKQRLTLIMMEAVANAHHYNPATAIQLVLNDHTHSDVIDGKEDLTASIKNMSEIEKNAIKQIATQLGLFNNPALSEELSRYN